VSGHLGDPESPVKVMVSEAGQERVVTYLPAGKARLAVQELEIPKNLSPAAREACVRQVAGVR
jgi:hypothetical protein